MVIEKNYNFDGVEESLIGFYQIAVGDQVNMIIPVNQKEICQESLTSTPAAPGDSGIGLTMTVVLDDGSGDSMVKSMEETTPLVGSSSIWIITLIIMKILLLLLWLLYRFMKKHKQRRRRRHHGRDDQVALLPI